MRLSILAAAALVVALPLQVVAQDSQVKRAWPEIDWSTAVIDPDELMSGGPPRDGIPPIDAPRFEPVSEADYAPNTPVIGLEIGGDARAYPLSIMTWHEIVNDSVGGEPVAVTYCPLCNAAIVFERVVGGRVLTFGTSGLLRNSDLVMWDRQTASLWQQFTGEGIVGEMAGVRLTRVPARLESWERFAARNPEGQALLPPEDSLRPYGENPYAGYDTSARPFLYRGDLPDDIPPMQRVVLVDGLAVSLARLAESGAFEEGDIRMTWTEGQASALDASDIAQGRDVGNVVVQRREGSAWVDVPYDVTFAFVVHAFEPDADWRI